MKKRFFLFILLFLFSNFDGKRGERLLLPWAKPAGGEEDEFDMGGGGPPQAPVGGMRQPTALPGRPPPSVRVSSLILFLLEPLEI